MATQVYLRLTLLVTRITQEDFLLAGQDQSKVKFILLGLLRVELALHCLNLTLADRLIHLQMEFKFLEWVYLLGLFDLSQSSHLDLQLCLQIIHLKDLKTHPRL